MEARSVEELMIPLADYAVVPGNATLVDAVRKLKTVGRRLAPARQAARAVLVVDSKGRVIGQLGHLEILQALGCEHGLQADSGVLSRAGVSEKLLGSLAENLSFWRGDLEDACQRVRWTKVSELMRPIEESVTVDAPLSEAIHRIVMWQRPRILVTRGGRVVGVLRLADLFDAVSDVIDAGDARPESNGRPVDDASNGSKNSGFGTD
jgi:CBS domain-containing protein